MNTEFQKFTQCCQPQGSANLLRYLTLDHLSDISRREFPGVPHWKPTAGAAG